MPVICMLNKQNSLMKEPYVSFDKKYKMIMEKLHGSKIELPVGNGKQGQFSNGFYNCDYAYQRNMMMNHDWYWIRHVENMNEYFETVDYLKMIKFEKKQIILCHYPMLEWPGSRYVEAESSYLIHGHIHGTQDPEVYGHIKRYQPHALNAGVDINGFEPVTFENLKENNNRWYERG